MEQCDSIEKVIVVQRTMEDVPMKEGRDVIYADVVREAPTHFEPAVLDSEDMLYILYTSGTTGKPKGIVHTTGGYLTGVHRLITTSSTSKRTRTCTGARPTSDG